MPLSAQMMGARRNHAAVTVAIALSDAGASRAHRVAGSAQCIVAAASLWLCAPARAQSFHLYRATLADGGAEVGSVSGLAVVIAWRTPTRARLRHQDLALAIEGDIDLAQPTVFLQAGVGRHVKLEGTWPWRVTMRRGTWAPVLRRGQRGIRIGLPRDLPAHGAWIPAGTSASSRAPGNAPWDETERISSVAEAAEPLPDCAGLTIFARPHADAPLWRPANTEEGYVVRRRGSWAEVEIRSRGFRVRGFARFSPDCEQDAGLPEFPGIAGLAADGAVYGRSVRLPAGTRLFATVRSAQPFAVLRRPATALEPLYESPHVSCTAGDCTREPPEPRGPARWLVSPATDDLGYRVELAGWVREPAEALADTYPSVRNSTSGIGSWTESLPDWPRPAPLSAPSP